VALAQFYDPDRSKAFDAKMLRVFRELSRVVSHAPVTTAERRRMWLLLARRAWWDRSTLSREARGSVRRAVRASFPQFMTAHPAT
jgi:hypothetical protein